MLGLLAREVFNVLVGVVDDGVETARNVEQLVINTFDRAAQRAGELGRGIARALRRLGVDEVDDCLSLGEVELSVQDARCVNSPGRACRAPAANAACSTSLSTTGEPWQWSSALSSPV